MSYLEELLPEFRKGAKIRLNSWEKGRYLYFKDGKVYNSKNGITSICVDSLGMESSWEFYQEPIDWQFIINHKCLCWFWDDEKEKRTGYLTSVGIYSPRFEMNGRSVWAHCRPVHKDEVTFYEDRNDD